MRTRLSILIVLAMVVAVVGAAPVSATASVNVTGEFTTPVSGGFGVERGTSGNQVLYRYSGAVFVGVMDGVLVGDGVTHLNHQGEFTFIIDGTFEGCVYESCGTLRMRTQGTGSGLTGEFAARIVILGGTLDLANLRGQGTIEGTTGEGGTYSMNLHLDPAS